MPPIRPQRPVPNIAPALAFKAAKVRSTALVILGRVQSDVEREDRAVAVWLELALARCCIVLRANYATSTGVVSWRRCWWDGWFVGSSVDMSGGSIIEGRREVALPSTPGPP